MRILKYILLGAVISSLGFVYLKSDKIGTEVIKIKNNIVDNSGNLLVGASTLFAQNASVQLNLAFYGEIKPDGSTCSNGQILKKTGANDWDCAADSSGGGGASSLEVRIGNPLGLSINPTATISFDANNFDLTASGSSDAVVKIDYTNGPASRSIAQTWSGLQTFSASPLSIQGTSASLSGNFEVGGYASASAFVGSAFPATNCNGTSFLQWAITGLFGCGTPSGTAFTGLLMGEGTTTKTHIDNLTFSPTSFNFSPTASNGILTLDYANGPASRSLSQTWTGLPTFSIGASVSANLEVSNLASISTGFVNNYLDLNGIANPVAPPAGRVRLHSLTTNGFTRLEEDDEGTTNITLGRDNVIVVNNDSGGSLALGDVVYIKGSTGNVPTVGKARANAATTVPALGIVMDAMNNGAYGRVMTKGVLTMDTSAFSGGTQVYVSTATAGALQGTRPSGISAAYVQRIGTVMTQGASGLIDIVTAPFVGNQETGTVAATWTGNNMVATNASISTNFEVVGFASASKYFGSAFGSTGDCNDATDKFLYDQNTGLFTCGTIADADIPDTITASNYLPLTGGTLSGKLTINHTIAGQDALAISHSDTNAYGIYVNLSAQTPNATNYLFRGDSSSVPKFTIFSDGSIVGGNASLVSASLSANFEAVGYASASQFFGGYASHQFNGTIVGPTGGNILSIGTIANKLKNVVSDVIRAITKFVLPARTASNVNEAGAIAVNTASNSLNFYGTAEQVIDPKKCIGTSIADADLGSKKQFTIFTADDPYTVAQVQATASGSNSLSWNLLSNSGTVPTTKIFTNDKQASGTAIVKYTSFAAATINDGNKLDFVISSASATLNSVYVRTCLNKTP